ncbi:hypothetical protein M5689_015924 [Euphorbia peplus]|nr:hypothetical protein M5689_015924 [Euphorbia peplus]
MNNKDKDPSENTSKRQHHKHPKVDISRNDNENDKEERLGLGVFDFPWRKESMINSISDEWCFEDSFFLSFNNNTRTTTVEYEFPDQCLSESAETFVESIDFPSDKFEETVWSLEKESVDCTLT